MKNNPLYKTLNDKVVLLLRNKNLTIKDICETLGVSTTVIYRIQKRNNLFRAFWRNE